MDYVRSLDLSALLAKKSFFLFGPRSTGKSFWIHKQLGAQAHIYSLLDSALFLRLQQQPSALRAMLAAEATKQPIVVIDEIQKVPQLLSEVHLLLEQSDYRFLLTGSSARKLRQDGVDLLAGRAWTAHMFPLTWKEIPAFSLDHYLLYGGLPQVYPSAEPREELGAYADTYLKEEILAEGLIRKLPPFSRFLKVAALCNGQLMNYADIGRDCDVSPSTVREYIAVLEDTLVAFQLPAWTRSTKRKAIQKSKFYLFDPGVTHWLAGTKSLDRNSTQYGNSLEQFIGMELRAYLSYRRCTEPLTYWRTKSGFEVDFLVGEQLGVEVKATNRITAKHVRGLNALHEEHIVHQRIVVSHDSINQTHGNCLALHWEEFLQRLWNDQLITL